ncbi:MAG: aromatic aminobenezylarsenical efflux permease ArsG family transporter [Bacteroidales bacterium]|nr:aromatic aminobenezylarsenical efflux permease ArsG family transporter [Bacteroidales bacterium]
MQTFLTELYASAPGPLISALLLGLLIALAPCPMTINITAMGYIGKDITRPRKVFSNGVFYALGTVSAYTGLALILYLGADQFRISTIFQQYSEYFIGPLLLLIGLYMLGLFRMNLPGISRLTQRFQNRTAFRAWDSFLVGLVFALAFCPYSGMLYFAMLIPLIITTASPWLSLPFSLAAGIPVVIFAWLLAFTVSGVGRAFNRLKSFELWFRRVLALVFIGIGSYYIIQLIS